MKKYKQETEVGNYYLDKGMRVQISLQKLLSNEDSNALNYHLKAAANIIGKYTEETPDE